MPTPANPARKSVIAPATTVGTLPAAPARIGYAFGGCCMMVNGGGTAFTATTPWTANVTVYAKWTPQGPQPYAAGDIAKPTQIMFSRVVNSASGYSPFSNVVTVPVQS
ncbi:MAG: hypothetical protein NT080_01320 [Spirochaetes bacterium]|nr:hypothetical protein [Spirochaetota bacterium]